MSTVIRRQMEAWGEGPPAFDEPVEGGYDLSDVIRVGMFLLEAIQRHEARWKRDVRAGRVAFDEGQAREVTELYERWYGPVPGVLAAVERVEAAGGVVDGADDFRAKVEVFHRTQFDPARVESSLKQFAEGGGRSLQELRDGVRRRHVG